MLATVAGCTSVQNEPLPPMHLRVWNEQELTWPADTPRPTDSDITTDVPFLLPSREDRNILYAGLNGIINGYDPDTQCPRFQTPSNTRLLVWVDNTSGNPSPYYANSITVFCYPTDWRTRARGQGLQSQDVGYLYLVRVCPTTNPNNGWLDLTNERAPRGVHVRPASPEEAAAVTAGPVYQSSWYWSTPFTSPSWNRFPRSYDNCRGSRHDLGCHRR
jgi:hypothetical protein